MAEINIGDKVKILGGDHVGHIGVISKRRETPGVASRPMPGGIGLPKLVPETVYDVRLDDQRLIRSLRPRDLEPISDDQANSDIDEI